jgi:hypothetical protein
MWYDPAPLYIFYWPTEFVERRPDPIARPPPRLGFESFDVDRTRRSRAVLDCVRGGGPE